MSDSKKDKIEVIPGLVRAMPAEQSMDIIRANLVEQFRLRESDTIGQVAAWLQSKDMERESDNLRRHFSDKLRMIAFQLDLDERNYLLTFGRADLPDELNWREISAMTGALAELLFSGANYQEQVAVALEFPAEKYDDLMACIKQGVKMEAEAEKKVKPIK